MITEIEIEDKNKKRLSRQGLQKADENTVNGVKKRFRDEMITKNGYKTQGYFIGKTILGKILLENEDAAGIMISFGMDETKAKNGELILVIEPATGIKDTDVPKIMSNVIKYATTERIGPDGLTPLIKPNPPQG